jgi:phage tail-like protein
MPDAQPYRNFNFVVEIDGVERAGFSEATLPSAALDVVEYREGADKTSVSRKLPGRLRLGTLVLRRGIGDDLALWQWFRTVADGELDRRNVAVILLDATRQPVRRWLLHDAWIVKIEGPELNAKGNEVAIETLELTCERLEVE